MQTHLGKLARKEREVARTGTCACTQQPELQVCTGCLTPRGGHPAGRVYPGLGNQTPRVQG